MKLVKCHIENFGKLSNFDFNFTAGLNCIKESNGWGKSTLATFIKAMFYGLPTTTKKDLAANERKKYSPWQGGNYGGNLVFAINQKQYKIERFFGKNKAEDTFVLIDLSTGKQTKAFTEDIGLEIFGLDADAFERSSYIPQKLLDSNLNESLAQKLNQIIQGTTDNYHYEDAYNALDQKRASLSNNKKTGQIQNLASDIEDVVTKIRDLETSGQSVEILQQQVIAKDLEINALLQEQNQVKQQINTYAQLQQKQANQELFTELNAKVIATKNEIQVKQAVFERYQTTAAEIGTYVTLEKTIAATVNAMNIKADRDYVAQRYQTLSHYFGDKVLTTETTDAVYHDILRYNALKTQSDNVVKQCTVSGNHRQRWLSFGLALFALLSILGGVLLLPVQLVGAVFLLVLGGVALLGAGFVYLINLINVKTSTPQHFDLEQLSERQTEMKQLKERINTFLEQYESGVTDYLTAYQNLMANIREYAQIKVQMAHQNDELNELSQKLTIEQKQLEKYLARFNFTNLTLNNAEKLTFLKQTLLDLEQLSVRLATETQTLEQFKTKKHFDVNESVVTRVDINELQQNEKKIQDRIDQKRDEKSQLIAQINKIQDDLAALNDLEYEKVNLQNNLNNLTDTLQAVKAAMKYLQVANESLATKFLAPMKNGLDKYLTLITECEFANLNLDTDFNITFEEYGKLREVDYYSKGYQNLINLCLRFALIDVLYGQEKPFIVLDDPFVNLDDDKIAKAKEFLQKLSENYQLIYFSCHESRC